jgi:membrane protein
VTVISRLDNYQRKHPWAGFPLAVLYKHIDDQGGYLAALIAYYGLLSLLPLLLLLSTVLGLVLAGHPQAQQQVLHSALSQFKFIGPELSQPKQISGGISGLLIGGLGALYGSLGVAQAVQNAMNTAWRVPRNSRPNPLKARGRGIVLLLTAGLALLATTVLSAIGGGAGPFGVLVRTAVLIASVLVNAVVFVFVFREATTRELTARQVAPGAVAAAVIWQLLQSSGASYVGHIVKSSSATNGVFALVLGLIGFLYLAAVALVLCVQANVVRLDRLYPRALLTPFTDRVELTSGDHRAYTEQAQAERSKGFQKIDVAFNPAPGQPAADGDGDPHPRSTPTEASPDG